MAKWLVLILRRLWLFYSRAAEHTALSGVFTVLLWVLAFSPTLKDMHVLVWRISGMKCESECSVSPVSALRLTSHCAGCTPTWPIVSVMGSSHP